MQSAVGKVYHGESHLLYVTSKVVRGGGERLRRYLMCAAVIAVMLAIAPMVSAGKNGGWGKGLLSDTLLFYVGTAEEPGGYMYWSPDTSEFKYDFHGYYLESGVVYYLICYEGEPGEEPAGFTQLGWCPACIDYEGVHIKGVMDWPGLEDVTVCLVPESYEGVGGSDPWSPDDYQIADGTIDL